MNLVKTIIVPNVRLSKKHKSVSVTFEKHSDTLYHVKAKGFKKVIVITQFGWDTGSWYAYSMLPNGTNKSFSVTGKKPNKAFAAAVKPFWSMK